MRFDFNIFIENLRDNEEKKEVVAKYEKQFGPIEGGLKDQIWYQNYISKFKTKEYLVPADSKDSFNWDLLMQLVAGSFSSDGLLDFIKEEDEDLTGSASSYNDPKDEESDISSSSDSDDEVEQEDKDSDSESAEDLESLPEFIISVNSWDQTVVKKVSELWGFQIAKLYEIYVEEQMNLQVLMKEEEKEREAIENKRQSRLDRWSILLEKLNKDKLEKEDEEQRASQIDDLKSML